MFIGRETELANLQADYLSSRSEMCIVYGRRRIGKSTLLKKFIGNKPAFLYTAGKEGKQLQIKRFVKELGNSIQDPLTAKVSATEWDEALLLLHRSIPNIKRERPKAVIILDEFQWMCRHSPELISGVQRFWDQHWSSSGDVFLILCGSSVSFMLGEVLSRKSPLFGRRTRNIRLRPFKLSEAAQFFTGKNQFEICESYMVAGGVPTYLEILNSKSSFKQSLVKHAFDASGFLFDEIQFVLSEQLKEKEHFFRVLSELALAPLEISELSKRTGIPTGQITYYMERLQLLGFVSRHIPIGLSRSSKKVKYRLDDFFIRFYFSFVHHQRIKIKNQKIRSTFESYTRGQWDAYAGYAFESIARQHAFKIAAKAGFADNIQDVGAYWQKPTKQKQGCQIDLIIQCPEHVTLICECKWSRKKTGLKTFQELTRKIDLFPNTQNHTIVPVIIAASGVTQAVRSKANLSVVQLKDLF